MQKSGLVLLVIVIMLLSGAWLSGVFKFSCDFEKLQLFAAQSLLGLSTSAGVTYSFLKLHKED